eukprot:GEMP01099494.1.p1 GENE.GEMP01099494.1~~GEMP01099494.1.p1  ORF type:complete len:256 (+),score=70.77 GEMP01099494.1:117-770(+)
MPSASEWMPLISGAALLIGAYYLLSRAKAITPEYADQVYARLQREWWRVLRDWKETLDHAPMSGTIDDKRSGEYDSIVSAFLMKPMDDEAHNVACAMGVHIEDVLRIANERETEGSDAGEFAEALQVSHLASQLEEEARAAHAKTRTELNEEEVLRRLENLWRRRKETLAQLPSAAPQEVLDICAPDATLARDVAVLEKNSDFLHKKRELWSRISSK